MRTKKQNRAKSKAVISSRPGGSSVRREVEQQRRPSERPLFGRFPARFKRDAAEQGVCGLDVERALIIRGRGGGGGVSGSDRVRGVGGDGGCAPFVVLFGGDDGFEVHDGHWTVRGEVRGLGVAESAPAVVPMGAAEPEAVAIRALFWVHLKCLSLEIVGVGK